MAYSKGRQDVRRYMQQLPDQIVRRVLIGAGRAGGNVVADEIRDNTQSEDVAAGVKVKVNVTDGTITTRIQAVGKGKFFALWEEYGTDPHFISVDDAQRGGSSVRKLNERGEHASLMIGGKFVGATVFHPGARAHPVWRPALDVKAAAAVAAAQAYINKRVTRTGILGGEDQEDGE
ncbi:MAG: HK97 gp10 family phage protein [Hyphomicrobiales bacterium]|nr:MAG: HK97 gp10 family phage protein [Hyphomicrobiales bacterium]